MKIKTLEDPLTALTKNESLLGGHYQRLAGAPKSISKTSPIWSTGEFPFKEWWANHPPTSLRLLKVENHKDFGMKIPGQDWTPRNFYRMEIRSGFCRNPANNHFRELENTPSFHSIVVHPHGAYKPKSSADIWNNPIKLNFNIHSHRQKKQTKRVPNPQQDNFLRRTDRLKLLNLHATIIIRKTPTDGKLSAGAGELGVGDGRCGNLLSLEGATHSCNRCKRQIYIQCSKYDYFEWKWNKHVRKNSGNLNMSSRGFSKSILQLADENSIMF